MPKTFKVIEPKNKTSISPNKTKYNSFLKLAICKYKNSIVRERSPLELSSDKFDKLFLQKLFILNQKHENKKKTNSSYSNSTILTNNSTKPILKELRSQNQILTFKKNKILSSFFEERSQLTDNLIKCPQITKSPDLNSNSDFQLTNLNQSSLFTNKNKQNILNLETVEDDSPANDIFYVERKNLYSNKRGQKMGKDSKGLRQMTRSLIHFLNKNSLEQFTLDVICSEIKVEKRKIYDLINILTSIKMIKRVSKGIYQWSDPSNINNFIKDLPEFSKILDSLKLEKSLGSMCYCFLSFMQSQIECTIEYAAENLCPSQKDKFNMNINFRSKIRRLYDISKILATIGLIENISENKKPMLRWVGIPNMINEVELICKSPFEQHLNNSFDMKTMLENIQSSLKSCVITISEDEMKRKRLESIDHGIVEKYLSNQQSLIVPSVSVVVPDL